MSTGKMISRLLSVAVVAGAGSLMLPSEAKALPVSNGLNTLVGSAFGLDENYIGAGYTMPNGVVGGAGGTAGMTESLTVTGLNLPQPALLPVTDARSTTGNPLLGGAARWGARTGAVIGWSSINATNLLTGNPLAPYAVTGVAYNLTPQAFIAQSAAALDDGSSPGSVAADTIPDFIPFVTQFNGKKVASVTLNFFGSDDGVLFGGTTPSPLIPRINLFEGGVDASYGPIPPGTTLKESDFDHNTGALSGTLAAFDDGTLLLTGEILDGTATLTWEEITAGSGTYQLDIAFQGTARYDGGSLFSAISNSPFQTISANWNNIPFAVGTGGLDFNGLDVFDFRGGAQSIGGSFSSDQSFNTESAIPEPATAGLSIMALMSLGAAALRRKRA